MDLGTLNLGLRSWIWILELGSCVLTGFLGRASRAGVALRAAAAVERVARGGRAAHIGRCATPQRWSCLPEDAHVCATNHFSNALRVKDGGCNAARLVLCRARRARIAPRASVANTNL